jgi:putative FmdB family regulatory protein
MPTYEYRCEKCGEQFDVFQSFKARPLRRHEACGGPVMKVFHPRGVTFKGSGFYANDSRPKNGSDSGSNGESSEPSSSSAKSKAEKKSDSKTSESKNSESKSSEHKASDSKLDARSS